MLDKPLKDQKNETNKEAYLILFSSFSDKQLAAKGTGA
jgi:hypothetical protein